MSAVILPAPAVLPSPRIAFSVDDRGGVLVRITNEPSDNIAAPISFVRVRELSTRLPEKTLYSRTLSADSSVTVRWKAVPGDVRLRVERLIVAGT